MSIARHVTVLWARRELIQILLLHILTMISTLISHSNFTHIPIHFMPYFYTKAKLYTSLGWAFCDLHTKLVLVFSFERCYMHVKGNAKCDQPKWQPPRKISCRNWMRATRGGYESVNKTDGAEESNRIPIPTQTSRGRTCLDFRFLFALRQSVFKATNLATIILYLQDDSDI